MPDDRWRGHVVTSPRPGPSTVSDARIQFGRHASLGLSVRPSGDRWWPLERDPGDHAGRHRLDPQSCRLTEVLEMRGRTPYGGIYWRRWLP